MKNSKVSTTSQQIKRPVILVLAIIGFCLSMISIGVGEQTSADHSSYFKNPIRVLLEPLPLTKHTNEMSESL